MKINEIIKQRRKELGLTQEQTANRLGVTASAVYKWEKGSACPDITVLPPLARLLKTDLNTLLSFQEELTELEVNSMVKEVLQEVEKNGYEQGFNRGQEIIREFPNCEILLFNMVSSLQGAQMLFSVDDPDKYGKIIKSWYERLAESDNDPMRNQANQMLFYLYFNDGQYNQAEKILQNIDETNPMYKQMLANLYRKQGRMDEAKKVVEYKLLSAAGEVQNALTWLQSAAIEEKEWDKARYMAEVLEKHVKTLELWEYGAYVLFFELYCARKDIDSSVRTLRKIAAAIDTPWNVKDSLLYGHIPSNQGDTGSGLLQKRMLPMLLELLLKDESMDFLRKSPEGAGIIQLLQEKKDHTEESMEIL